MKINGVLHVDQTPHQATLRLDKVVNNVPMCRPVDKAILAMYQEDFKKFE